MDAIITNRWHHIRDYYVRGSSWILTILCSSTYWVIIIIVAISDSNTWWNAKFVYLIITYVWPCIWVWSYKIWLYIWLYIGNNFDHIFEFDHNISDSNLTMYLSLPKECHTILYMELILAHVAIFCHSCAVLSQYYSHSIDRKFPLSVIHWLCCIIFGF